MDCLQQKQGVGKFQHLSIQHIYDHYAELRVPLFFDANQGKSYGFLPAGARDPLKSYGFRYMWRDLRKVMVSIAGVRNPQKSGSYKVTTMFPKVSKNYGFGSGQALVKPWASHRPPAAQ